MQLLLIVFVPSSSPPPLPPKKKEEEELQDVCLPQNAQLHFVLQQAPIESKQSQLTSGRQKKRQDAKDTCITD